MGTAEVGIYVDQHVYEHYGYDPADTLQSILGDCLEYNDINSWSVTVDTDHGFDVRDLSSTDPCSDILTEFEDYLKRNNLKSDYENHHLIYDQSDALAGCAWPRVSVGHGNSLHNLDTFDPPRYAEMKRGTSETTAGDAMKVSMQEIGHTLGICDGSDHDCGMLYTSSDSVHGNPTLPGDGDDGYNTPLGVKSLPENQCSEEADDPDTFDVEYADGYYWYYCAGSQLRSKFN